MDYATASRHLAVVVLVVTAVESINFIIVGGFRNGFMGLAQSWSLTHPNLLPFSSPQNPIFLRKSYTGFEPLDELIGRLTPFFWPLINGQKPELTLFGIYMFGQIWASETLLIVEGWRMGNKGRAVSFSTIWGLIWQNLPWGFIQPVYSVVHLLTSPIAKSPAAPSAAMISVGAEVLSTLHLALLIGYGLPSILMCLPAPSWISYNTKQIFLFAWQLFPFLVGMTHASGVRMAPQLQSPLKTIDHRRAETLHGLRSIYTLAITIAGFTHWLTICLVLFNRPLSVILPSVLVASDPGAVFRLWPAIPNFAHFGKIPQVADIAEGFLVLLQYDTLFAGLGILVWATCLNRRVDQRGESWKAIVSPFIHTAICGPCGAAVYQMQERDETVFKDWALGRKEK